MSGNVGHRSSTGTLTLGFGRKSHRVRCLEFDVTSFACKVFQL